MYNLYTESRLVLRDGINSDEYVQTILEDANSPVTRKYQEKLYESIINKSHIDFGDIPKSNGNIRNYSGYNSMVETLDVIANLAIEKKANNVIEYVDIVKTAIHNIEELSSTYEKGFNTKTKYVAMEYDTYVYLCVEATTALIYSFVEVVKNPSKRVLDMTIKNTKMRADEFYFNQLKTFNAVQRTKGIDYRKMLEEMCKSGKENFLGTAEVVGLATIMAVAMSIVPLTRECIYQIYSLRGKLSENLDMQAAFLELNKTCIEGNDAITEEKKKKIIDKQSKQVQRMRRLADKLRVKSAKSIVDSQKEIGKDNKDITVDSIRKDISDSPFELI